VLERVAPSDGGLHRVARPPDAHVRDEAQARQVLDGLVRRTVLAEADRIVREHEHDAVAHQRSHAHGVARVVRKHQERAAVGDETSMQRDAIHDRAHAEFADAVVEVVAPLRPADRLRSFPIRVVRAGQVGRTAEQLGHHGAEHVEHLLRR
jgi:hypothetical protein